MADPHPQEIHRASSSPEGEFMMIGFTLTFFLIHTFSPRIRQNQPQVPKKLTSLTYNNLNLMKAMLPLLLILALPLKPNARPESASVKHR